MTTKDPIDIMLDLKTSLINNENLNEQLKINLQTSNTNNEILIKQDQLLKFKNDKLNEQLIILNNIESNIINKDALINQTNLNIINNDRNINLLYLSLGLSLILFFCMSLYYIGHLNDRLLNIIITTILVIYVFIIMYIYNIFHFRDFCHFFDNRKFMNLLKSVNGLKKYSNVKYLLYGNKQDYIDENCDCPPEEKTYSNAENVGVDINPGYFYYDKNAPKQNLIPDGGSRKNVSLKSDKEIYDKIKWVDHDKNYDNNYNIEPNNNKIYEDGNLSKDDTYTINL